jgi:hypothetical protein
MALICGFIFFYIGMRNPAERDFDRWRQRWTYADILAVVLTIIGVVKLMSPYIDAERAQREESQRIIAIGKKENILYAVNRAQDKFCPVTAAIQADLAVTCDVIRKMQRSFLMQRADHITANVVLNEDLPAICVENRCDADIADIRQKIIDFRDYSKNNRGAFEGQQPMGEGDVIDAMILTALYIAVSAFRLGRSGAEFQRNRLAKMKAANGSQLKRDGRTDVGV